MSFKIRVQPTDIGLVRQADADFKKNARRLLRSSSDVLLKHVQFQLRRRKGPEPSRPGEPPAMQTGRLAKSFKRLRVRLRRGYGSAGVTTDHTGAYALEVGEARVGRATFAITGSRRARRGVNKLARALAPLAGVGVYRVAPRPYLDPASEEAAPQIDMILVQVVE
jgi:hypothetical protein